MADSPVSPPTSRTTLRAALDDYLRSLKPETRRQHERYVRSYVDFMPDPFEVGQLTGSRVESYAEAQIRPTDPNAQDRVAALKAWFQFLKKKEYVSENYGIHIRVRKPSGRAAAGRSTGQRKEEEPIEMTAEGIEALRSELAEIDAGLPAMEQAIAHAREDGDLRENAPYHAAREAMAFKAQRKQQIEAALKRAVVAGGSRGDRSAVGSTVTVTRLDRDETIVYKLVGAREANAGEKKISVESPVGKQLLGRRPGDEVEITVPSGVIQYRVDAVSS
jgi:transcription elongation factor GreA